ncbi:glutathione-dependent formaldehyde dehydrogenase [Pseudoxanthomonas helianthi]|uniref:Glutathione-dependent formaldehyde dehydrogenase n=1 Tax=Pseudoxanthomonas helianthi TaxID=1453541 RepID=A0A940X0B3_9GAMM|nr:zinc-dependent alcohol dehydrogenase [Pseudoxanthomonas helianthi]MBP3983397.1 glutathione-dependent formaldehyde dehydrogenase [Pseudoxanthomonas helianthi]
MHALTYHGNKDVRVETVPDPELRDADDIILRVTATAICGSDLHIFRGKIPGVREGDVLGHEFMGVVESAGRGVTEVAKGDRVVIPFVIACGECFFCKLGEHAACECTNTGSGTALNRHDVRPPAALFGYGSLYGSIPGGQAEYVRVPHANVGPLRIPDELSDEQVLFLSDILPTGYQATINAAVRRGTSVAIFGAGPVGLMAAACCRMMGAERIFMVDHHPYRLDFAARTYDVQPINFDEQDDPVAEIVEATAGRGVDACIDAVGFEAKGSIAETVLTTVKLEGSSGTALRQCIAACRRGGVISVAGVYAGVLHAFLFGDAFDKGLHFAMGQTHVQRYLPELLYAVQEGRLHPEAIISHQLPLQEAAKGYAMFNDKQDDCRKVILTP